MPPTTILEVLRILKAEVDLRELTRVTEQTKETMSVADYVERATELSSSQEELRGRVDAVTKTLRELEQREKRNFARDLARLAQAEAAMNDARDLLAEPNTGGPAIAAETEAIEALLATRRAGKGGGGGGGGDTPGGGTGGGTREGPAVALIGSGVGEEAAPREVVQATGRAESKIPAEYRTVLDAYFGALEEEP